LIGTSLARSASNTCQIVIDANKRFPWIGGCASLWG
jgi:hypothetical protein